MFPGARADREAAEFVILGAPLDISTTGRPGTRYGPTRIREAARSFEDYDHHMDTHFTDLQVHDAGDVRAWDDVAAYLEFLTDEVRSIVIDEATPVLLGGEHTVSLAGIRAVEPSVVVSLDAHLDLRADLDGNEFSHACVMRRALECDSVEELVVLGARAGSEEEWDRASLDDVTVVEPEEVDTWEVPSRFEHEQVYCSIDVDCMDPAVAPGTGTLEPFGLQPRVVRDVVRSVAPHVTGFDVVEVSDRDAGQAAALGGKLVREFVYSTAS